MKPNLNLIVAGAALVLAGCGKGGNAVPTGQVVATVDGQEVTLEDLRAETGQLAAQADPNARKAAEQAALQQIVARTIVADYARKQKLDQTPIAAILRHRAEQDALVGLVQRKLLNEVPVPSREEVDLFIRDHPSSFAQRRIFVVDQIIATGVPPALAKTLEGQTTLAQVRETLDGAGVKFNQTVGAIDAVSIDADAAEKLASLPTGTMFISPEGEITRINLIRSVAISPIGGADAQRLAREAIQSNRAAALTQRQIAGIVQQGLANVRYNAAYRPAQQGRAGPVAGAQ